MNPSRTIAVNSNTNVALVAAVAGTTVRVVAYALSAQGAVNVKFSSGNGVVNTDLCGPMAMVAGTPLVSPTPLSWSGEGRPQFQTVKGQALNLNLSVTNSVGGYVIVEESSNST